MTRALEGVFVVVALFAGLLLFATASLLATEWLKAAELPKKEITQSLQLIAFIIALRWMSGLYRGVITGAERLVWLSGFNSLVATGRFVLVLPVLMYVSATPLTFFAYQLGMAMLELIGLAWMAYRLLPPIAEGQRIQWQWAPLKPVLKFSMSIAFTSSVWVFVTQTDKLILSKLLPLADYGYFSVAVLVASGIMIVSSPISSAIMPRMTRLHAERKDAEVIAVYRRATQIVSVTAIPIAILLIFFSPKILWAWTGDSALVERAASVLRLYATGYAFLAVSAFPFYLQYARGDLRLHMIGNALFVVLLIPSVIWAANIYGMNGAGWAWLLSNAIYFAAWTPIVHHRFSPGLHKLWLLRDIVSMTILPLLVVGLCYLYFGARGDRLYIVLELIFVALILSVLSYVQLKLINRNIE
ncbi:oligosaccharide flippase family protein [Ideonella paludis]|uniref:oligosaccharide flippase family protein n=1 Tax=Ideonella paludis TaxID=1233411 RepID=UPI00362B2BA0